MAQLAPLRLSLILAHQSVQVLSLSLLIKMVIS